ncbi:MAG TPA: spermine synthase [Gammaproteobacteria bacterium]|nr:spermine synthase [Gammaproteobacteria bacterium]
MLAIQFGASILGVVITAAAFMAGLGLGSLVGVRWRLGGRAALYRFALIEFAVALYALALPWLFQALDAQLGSAAADLDLGAWHALQSFVGFSILFVPALGMGLAFPLVLRALGHRDVPVSVVYGVNTLGGVAGALLPLALLPVLGWMLSFYIVAFIGLSLALAVTLVTRRWPANHSPSVTPDSRRPANTVGLLMYALVGAGALMLEIGWTRLLGMLLLRTEYVMAILLAVFLAGIGLGSLMVRHRFSGAWYSALPVAACLFGLASLWALPWVASWADGARFDSLGQALLEQGLVVAALTLPATVVLGAWLPVLCARLKSEDPGAGAWLYGANSLGAAAGVLLAGLVLVPTVGTSATICIAALLLLLAGMYWARQRRAWALFPLAVLLALPVWSLPEVQRLLPRSQAGVQDLAHFEDALSITHVVAQDDGQRLLLADLRRMDASTEPTAVEAQKNQARLPLLLHPHPKTVLFLGLGTGISAAGALPYPGVAVTAVELSSGAIRSAARWFAPVNNGISTKATILRDDARRYLRGTTARFDLIIGDLFHPDLVGRGNLLSVQQFRRARARLAEGGLFVQWLALNQFDSASLDTVLRSFKQAFPDAQLFVEGFRLALVGPRDTWQGMAAGMKRLRSLTNTTRDALTGGEGLWTWAGRYWGPIKVGTGPVQDEWQPRIEYSLPQARYTRGMDLSQVISHLLSRRPGLKDASTLLGLSGSPEAFERAYVATELALRSWVAGLQQRPAEAARLLRLAYNANPKDRWISFSLADQMFASLEEVVRNGRTRPQALQAILDIRPDHVGALKTLRQLERERGNNKAVSALTQVLHQISPLDNSSRQRSAPRTEP